MVARVVIDGTVENWGPLGGYIVRVFVEMEGNSGYYKETTYPVPSSAL